MAGQIEKMINLIVAQKSKGNAIIASSVRTKMILKGINVDKYNSLSPDDPKVIQGLREIAKEFGVTI